LKLKALMMAILVEVVNILLRLARVSLKLADMIFKVLLLDTPSHYLIVRRVKMFHHLLLVR